MFGSFNSICLLFWSNKSLLRRQVLTNVLLAICLISLAMNSVVQGHSFSYAFLFSPFVCFVAAHLLGTRAAWAWTAIVAVLSLVVYFVPVPVSQFEFLSITDKFVFNVGMTIAVFLLTQHAERFVAARTDQLVTLTMGLQDKTSLLERLANHDTLTGVANRYKFEKALNRTVDLATQNDEGLTLFVLDIDGFKEINDALGHSMGDRVLRETAQRLKQNVSPQDLVARFGGDEFTIIIKKHGFGRRSQ